jgi:hypothetical protein
MPDPKGDDPDRWNEVYAARSRLYEEAFGPMPAEVLGSWNFPPGAWPGGCLVDIAGRRPDDGRITSTFGLSNPGLVPSRPGIAGHGYELLICTRGNASRPLELLRRIATQVLTTGFSFLPEVDRFGGSFIDTRFVVVPGFARVPRGGELPTGRFLYLVVLPISAEEHAQIHAAPMVETLPVLVASRRDEWIADLP